MGSNSPAFRKLAVTQRAPALLYSYGPRPPYTALRGFLRSCGYVIEEGSGSAHKARWESARKGQWTECYVVRLATGEKTVRYVRHLPGGPWCIRSEPPKHLRLAMIKRRVQAMPRNGNGTPPSPVVG